MVFLDLVEVLRKSILPEKQKSLNKDKLKMNAKDGVEREGQKFWDFFAMYLGPKVL